MEYIEIEVDKFSTVKVSEFVENQLEQKDVGMKTIMRIIMAIDEIYSNIVNYSKANLSKVGVEIDNNLITLQFVDNGIEYDPCKKDEVDITLSAEERNIGGLGIHMVKKIMDSIEYKRDNNKNILNLTKNY